jgi:hypothetical protein
MAFLWDLYQQSQIRKHKDRTANVEQRLEQAEEEIDRLSALVHELIGRLESKLGADLDQDGRVG